MNTRTYSVRSQAVSTVKKSQAMTPSACARRNSVHVGPLRRGAGPARAVRIRVRTVVALTRMPSFRSSPWIRTQPQRGFSRASLRMSARSSSSIGGRPGRRVLRSVHFPWGSKTPIRAWIRRVRSADVVPSLPVHPYPGRPRHWHRQAWPRRAYEGRRDPRPPAPAPGAAARGGRAEMPGHRPSPTRSGESRSPT